MSRLWHEKRKKNIYIYIWVLIKKIVERWVKVVLYWEVPVIQNGLSTLAAFIRLLFHWNWRAIHSIMNVSISLFSLGLTASYCIYQKGTDYFVRIKFRHCSLKKIKNILDPESIPRRKTENFAVTRENDYVTSHLWMSD